MKNEKRPPHGGGSQNKQLYDTTKAKLLSILTNKPQSRYVLADRVGVSERQIRQTVHDLRSEGHLIISDSRGGGYRLGTKKDAVMMAREMRSRAYDLLRTANTLEGVNPDQITIGEVADVL